MRAFISIDCDGLPDRIRQLQQPLDLPGVDPVAPGQAHMTLRFLGDIEEDRLPAITDGVREAVDDSEVDGFDCELGGYGVFPSLDYISVIWLGVRTGVDRLEQLQAPIEEAVQELGFDPPDNAFTPHITLARMRDARSKDRVRKIVEGRDPDGGRLSVEEIRLKESVLTDDGPEYRTIERFPL